jgi:hypothetical protein
MNFYMKQFSLTTQTSKKLSQSNIDLKKWPRIPAYTSGSLPFKAHFKLPIYFDDTQFFFNAKRLNNNTVKVSY